NTLSLSLSYFFLSVASPTEIYSLSLHDALPIYLLILLGLALGSEQLALGFIFLGGILTAASLACLASRWAPYEIVTGFVLIFLRSEEHTSELQSLRQLVCRLLLEKKKKEKRY